MVANKRTGDTIDDVEVGALVARSQAFHPLKGSKQIVTDKLPPPPLNTPIQVLKCTLS